VFIFATHAHTFVILVRILANAVALHVRIREYQDDQQTYHTLAEYPIPDDIGIDSVEKQRHFEVCTFI
jgi:hypothetical protein